MKMFKKFLQKAKSFLLPQGQLNVQRVCICTIVAVIAVLLLVVLWEYVIMKLIAVAIVGAILFGEPIEEAIQNRKAASAYLQQKELAKVHESGGILRNVFFEIAREQAFPGIIAPQSLDAVSVWQCDVHHIMIKLPKSVDANYDERQLLTIMHTWQERVNEKLVYAGYEAYYDQQTPRYCLTHVSDRGNAIHVGVVIVTSPSAYQIAWKSRQTQQAQTLDVDPYNNVWDKEF